MTSNINKLNNKNFFILIFFILASGFTSYLLFSIHSNEKLKIESIEDKIIAKTKNHFYSVKEIQLWNTDNDGIYIRNSNLKPNKHLTNNQYKIKDTTLTRISHHRTTKQFSRHAKEFNAFYYKITSLNPLLKENIPDDFEEKGLNYFKTNDKPFFTSNIDESLKKGTFDLIGALKVEKNCLECHQKQGYKVGDNIGGIRISVDTTEELKEILAIKEEFSFIKILVVTIILIFVILTILLIIYIFNQKEKLKLLNDNLEEKVRKRTQELDELNATLEDKIKIALEKNKKQEELMIIQSRHAAMGEMISMIAHQWRQPISVISMAANNIKVDVSMDMMDPTDMDSIADDILDQTDYLSTTIDDFRDFFRPNKKMTEAQPSDIIKDSIKIIEKSLENNNITLLQNFEETIKIDTYPKELLQVLINILKNAKEAFSKKDIENKTITINLYQNKSDIVIEVLDNAGGIDEKIIDSIFDPYFSTKDEKNGTGLGLYMSETIINKHLYGKLEATNINDGAMFCITLPIKLEEM